MRNSASLWTWPGPNATSTNGKRSNTSSLTDCAQQPPTPTSLCGRFALQPLGLSEVCDEAAVGRLPDRARVEQDQVRLPALRRLAVAERLEHAPHPLGVVLVHLAAEGGEVVVLSSQRSVDAAAPGGSGGRPQCSAKELHDGFELLRACPDDAHRSLRRTSARAIGGSVPRRRGRGRVGPDGAGRPPGCAAADRPVISPTWRRAAPVRTASSSLRVTPADDSTRCVPLRVPPSYGERARITG